MITVKTNTKDPYTRYGIEHFKSLCSVDSDTVICHGDVKPPKNKHVIHVSENSVLEDRVVGLISGGSTPDIPVFQKPVETWGEATAFFKSDSEGYGCVSDRDGIGFDVFHHVGRMLTGHLDKVFSDIGGGERPFADVAVADHYERILYKLMNVEKMNPWPDERKFVLCLTHDVDRIDKTYQSLTHGIRSLKNGGLGGLGYHLKTLAGTENPYWNFHSIMGLEDRLNVKSTFFILDERGRATVNPGTWWRYLGRPNLDDNRLADVVKELGEKNWEIGLHGSYESYVSQRMLEQEKNRLEHATGTEVTGVRQHNLNLNSPETWRIHEKLDLKYDCSLGFNHNVGFRWGTCRPFRPYDGENTRTLNIWEIPTTVMDNPLMKAENPWKNYQKIVEEVMRHQGVLNIIWHQAKFNKKEFPGYTELYEKIIKDCRKKGAWITTCNEVVKWMNQH